MTKFFQQAKPVGNGQLPVAIPIVRAEQQQSLEVAFVESHSRFGERQGMLH